MAHLIDKDALVAHLSTLLDKKKYSDEYDVAFRDGNNSAIYAISHFLNTIEVKEADFEKEYVRTDAFIEKACAFFEENIEEEDCKIGSSEWTELRAEYKSLDSFIRAFVKYMK